MVATCLGVAPMRSPSRSWNVDLVPAGQDHRLLAIEIRQACTRISRYLQGRSLTCPADRLTGPQSRHSSGPADGLERQLLFQMVGSVAGKAVLDVGCNGVQASEFAGLRAIVTGLDTDPAMIALASTQMQLIGDLVAVHSVGIGTSRRCLNVRYLIANGGMADTANL